MYSNVNIFFSFLLVLSQHFSLEYEQQSERKEIKSL